MELAQAQRLWHPEPGWLNTASYGLPPDSSWDALQAALADWRVGRTSWEGWDEATGRSRGGVARRGGGAGAGVAVGGAAGGLVGPLGPAP
ncbi:aminotransferase, partial [Micromonospora sp. NPDC000207]